MPRTPKVSVEGQEMDIPVEKAEEMPLTVSYSEAKKIAKSIRPPMSEKQKAHVQKLVELNKKRWEEKKKQKEAEAQAEAAKAAETKTKIVVKPKRIYKRKPKAKKATSEDDILEEIVSEDSESDDEVYQRKPRKKVVNSRQEPIEKVEKATKIIETVGKLDQAIDQLKSGRGRYDSILASKFKF